MAIIRYPDSREELSYIEHLVWYDYPGPGTINFSANGFTNKVLFIFDITILVYHRYQFIHSD